MTEVAFHYALNHVLVPSGRTLWLYAPLKVASGDVYSPLQNQAQALQIKGLRAFSDIDALEKDYDAVFINCPKQYEEAQGLIALALERSKNFVMAIAPNNAGGGRLHKSMQSFDVPVEQLVKDRCKIVWTTTSNSANRATVKKNLSHITPKPILLEGRDWWSVPGIFSWNQIDAGSKLLLQYLPSDLSGKGADLGCGYGYLSSMLEQTNSAITQIDAYDVDARAVACCKRNSGSRINAIWQDILTLNIARQYDFVVMNPPFHSGKEENVDLGKIFIKKAYQSLKPGGRLFMVANKHLAYEKVVSGLTSIYEGEGYKILTVRAS